MPSPLITLPQLKFSSIHTIRESLGRYATHFDARGVIMIALTRRSPLKSLIQCLAVGPSGRPKRLDELERLIANHIRFADLEHRTKAGITDGRPSNMTLSAVLRHLFPQADLSSELFKPLMPDSAVGLHFVVFSEGEVLDRLIIILAEPSPSFAPNPSPTLLAPLLKQVRDFPAVQILTHFEARHRLDNLIGDLSETLLSRLADNLTSHALSVLVQDTIVDFLRILIDVTGSVAGCWYVPARHSGAFERTCHRGVRPSSRTDGTTVTVPPIVQKIAEDHRPFVINDIDGFFVLNPELAGPLPGTRRRPDATAVLGIPVTAYDHHHAPVIAVALLLRRQPYLPLQLSTAEYLAGGYRQFTNTFLSRLLEYLPIQFSGSTTPLNSRQLPLLPPGEVVAPAAIPRDPRFDEIPCVPAEVDRIPLAVQDVDRCLRFILTVITAFTPCSFITFRALSVDRKSLFRHLCLKAKHLKLTVVDSIDVTEYRDSTNANVARFGRTAIVSDYMDPRWMAVFPELRAAKMTADSRSSMTIPVFMGKQLAGIVHAESTLPHAFGGIINVAERLVATLGAELDGAYLRRISDTFSQRSMRALARHKLRSARKELRSCLSRRRRHLGSEWPGVVRWLRQIHDSQRLLDREYEATSLHLHTLLARALREANADISVQWDPSTFSNYRVADKSVATAIRLICEELFINIGRATAGRYPPSSLSVSTNHFGGQDYLSINMTNSFNASSIVHGLQSQLFQTPIRRPGLNRNLAVGAVGVAAVAHSLGAQVYLRDFNLPQRRLTISFDIPLQLLRSM